MPPTPTPTRPRKVRFARSETGPWFSRQPTLALVVISVLYLAVFTLRILAGTPVDAYPMLYVLPVALAAAAFGRRAGVAGLLAVALIVTWTVVRDVTLGPSAWATRIIPDSASWLPSRVLDPDTTGFDARESDGVPGAGSSLGPSQLTPRRSAAPGDSTGVHFGGSSQMRV